MRLAVSGESSRLSTFSITIRLSAGRYPQVQGSWSLDAAPMATWLCTATSNRSTRSSYSQYAVNGRLATPERNSVESARSLKVVAAASSGLSGPIKTDHLGVVPVAEPIGHHLAKRFRDAGRHRRSEERRVGK